MQIRRKIFIVLCIYLSQIFFTPVIHCLGERNERYCTDCYAGIQLNSSCNNTDGPCNNPTHHHHNNHSHDPAQCTFCKSFIKDIEYVPVYYRIIFNYLSIVVNSTQYHSVSLLHGMPLVRPPPLKDFLT